MSTLTDPDRKVDRKSGPTNAELILALLALAGWMVLFVAGVSVNTTPYFHYITDSIFRTSDTRTYATSDKDLKLAKKKYQEQIQDLKPYEDYAIDVYSKQLYFRRKEVSGSIVQSLVIIGLCYTVTNVGLLCLLASLLGSVGRSIDPARPEAETGVPLNRRQYLSAALGGLIVYLIIFSGAYAIFGLTFSPPASSQVTEVNEARLNYAKLAMLASLFSFIEGYSPFVLVTIVGKAKNLFGQRESNPPPTKPTENRSRLPE